MLKSVAFFKRACSYKFKHLLYRIFYLMILCWKSKIWSVFSIWGPFLGVWEAILGHFRLHSPILSKNGVILRKTKISTFSVRVLGWLRWVALVKIIIFRRFRAHLIICLLLKIVFFLPIYNRLMGANLSGTDLVKCSFITLGQFFAYKNWFWWP